MCPLIVLQHRIWGSSSAEKRTTFVFYCITYAIIRKEPIKLTGAQYDITYNVGRLQFRPDEVEWLPFRLICYLKPIFIKPTHQSLLSMNLANLICLEIKQHMNVFVLEHYTSTSFC